MVNELIKKEAGKREELHANHKSSRPLSEDYEYIGFLGEFEFGKLVGLMPDFTLRKDGDKGVDFRIKLGFTVDIKTAEKAGNLIHEKGKPFADIFVLAEYCKDDDNINLIGWEWGKILEKAPCKDFGYGIINHYIHRSKLKKMDELICRLVK